MKLDGKILILSGLFLTSSMALAEQNCTVLGTSSDNTYAGITHCTDITTSAVTVNGPLRAKNTKFSNNVTVNGPIMMKDSQVSGNTNVHGPLLVKDSKFNGEVTIFGPIYANNSTFAKKLVITSNKAAFKHSTIGPIVMKKSSDGQQKLYIADKSTVKGDITFEQGNGIVYLSKDSKISGKVIGGTIEQKDKELKFFEKDHDLHHEHDHD